MSIQLWCAVRRFFRIFPRVSPSIVCRLTAKGEIHMKNDDLYPVMPPVSPAFPVPPMPPVQQNAHHGRTERCAKSAYDAIMHTDWPAHIYADDVFEPESEQTEDERLR